MGYLVYLAGPITGLSYDGCTDWREKAREDLLRISGGQIDALSPMRHKESLKEDMTGEKEIKDAYENSLLSSQRGITARDKFDCLRSNLVLVNVLGATRVSIGTCMEIAWANSVGNPLVLVMEENGNPHDHAMLRECCPFRTPSLEVGVETAYCILCP